MRKLLVSLLATVVVAVVVTSAVPEADACLPPQAFELEVVEDETPECVEIERGPNRYTQKEDSTVDMRVRNECDETLEMEAVDCVGCDEEVVVEPIEGDPNSDENIDEYEEFVLEGDDWDGLEDGQTYEQYYTWELGDQEGDYTTETYFDSTDDSCQNAVCSTAGESMPIDTLVLFMVVAAILGVRRFERPENRQEA